MKINTSNSSNQLSNISKSKKIQYSLKSIESDIPTWSEEEKKVLHDAMTKDITLSEKIHTCFIDKVISEYAPDEIFNPEAETIFDKILLDCNNTYKELGDWSENIQKKFIEDFRLKWPDKISDNIIKCLLKNVMKKYTYIEYGLLHTDKKPYPPEFVSNISKFIASCSDNCSVDSECPLDKKCIKNICTKKEKGIPTVIIIMLILGVCAFICLLIWYFVIRDKNNMNDSSVKSSPY